MLINRFSRSLLAAYRYGTNCLSREATDVLLLKGLSTPAPYVLVEGQKLSFKLQQPAINLMTQQPVEFFNNNSVSYHALTPQNFILSQSFFLKWRGVMYYVIRNEPLVRDDRNTEFFQKYGGISIEPLARRVLEDLPKSMDGPSFHNLLLKNIMEFSEPWKLERQRLETLLKVVENKIGYMDRMWAPIEETLKHKADRRVRTIIYLMLGQFAIMNYFVYFYLSWDIMEPVTVLFANLEVLIAYFFFVVNRREYGFKEVSENYFEHKKLRQMRKYAFDFQRYRELSQIREYLRMKLVLRGTDVNEVVSLLQSRIKLLDNN